MAASLAHAALVFADKPELSKLYWEKAKLAYKQTGVESKSWGNSNTAFSDLAIYYTSSGLVSHVFFGAASMYAACKALKCSELDTYLQHTNELGLSEEDDGGKKWFWEVPGWDNAWWDGAVLMASEGIGGPDLAGQPAYPQMLAIFVDKWVNGKAPVQYVRILYLWLLFAQIHLHLGPHKSVLHTYSNVCSTNGISICSLCKYPSQPTGHKCFVRHTTPRRIQRVNSSVAWIRFL
jgi:hypothetical protein